MIAYSLYEGPLAQPGACVCGSQTMPMVDTHRLIAGYGRVYLCPLCVLQTANAHRYVGRADYELAIGDLAAQVDRLEAELERAREERVVPLSVLLDEVRRANGEQTPEGVTI